MAEVYQCSRNTIIWLGELNCAEEIYEQIREVRSYITTEVTSFEDDPYASTLFLDHCSRLESAGEATLWDVDRKLILKLCAQPYFRRKWIIQEVISAKSAVMLCSDARMSWSDFMKIFHSLDKLAAFPLPEDSILDGRILAMSNSPYDDPRFRIDCIREIMQNHEDGNGHLLNLLHSAAAFSCGDPRDHLYALLAIAKGQEALAITPNYDLTPEEVFQDFAVKSLSQKCSRLPLLLFHTDRSLSSALNLPSWVPDWTRIDLANPISDPTTDPRLFQATRDLPEKLNVGENCSSLQVLGIRLCEVSATVVSLFDCLMSPATSDPVWLSSHDVADWRLNTWFELCRSTAEKANLSDQTILCLTLTCGVHWYSAPYRAQLGHGATIFRGFQGLAIYFDSYRRYGAEEVDTQQMESVENDLDPARIILMAQSLRRRFFVTSGGLSGMGPRHMKAGDFVCLFYGSDVPYILRPDDEGTYTFVGHCYLQGMMDGEGLDLGLPEEEFTIR